MAVVMYSMRVLPLNTSLLSERLRGASEEPERSGARRYAGRHAGRYAGSVLPELQAFYYLKNFEVVLAAIGSRYADLLLPDELKFLAEFSSLPHASRALLTRMVMRQGSLFRASRLNYAEIGETRAAAEPLMALQWVSDKPPLKLAEFAGLIPKAALIECLKLPPRYARWCKPDLVVMLAPQYAEARTFEEWGCAQDFVYALLVMRLCERFRLMFFGNDRQTWTEFVTADLGIFRYEKIERSLHSRPFQTRVHIEVFQRIQECRELLAAGMPLDELARLVPEPIKDSEWLEERRQKLLFLLAREYERARDHDSALERYLACNYRGARSRAIRLKVKAQDWAGARALCDSANEYPEGAAELQHVRRVLPRIHRKLNIPVEEARAAVGIPEFEVVFDPPLGLRSVECQVRDHLARGLAEPSTVRYVENELITALFGLLCWPAIFAPVRGAFFHDFHHGPVDLESVHFHRRRGEVFEACLSALETGDHAKVIRSAFKEKWGIQSPFVRWSHLDRPLLEMALTCFPAAHLRGWFEWILKDAKENRAGFPDLVQFWPAERRYRLIEVKGPGDRLQDNQKRLLEYCVELGMPVEVCHARYRGPMSSDAAGQLGLLDAC